jgi:multiple sugar transport system substrate-binding protein
MRQAGVHLQRRTRRQAVLASATGVVSVVIAACSPGGQAVDSKTPATIDIWHPWDAARESLFNKMIADFQAIYPHITVKPTIVVAADHPAKYVAATAGGTPPAIANPDKQDLPAQSIRGYFQPLDALMKQEKVPTTDYYEPDIKNSTYAGKINMLPAYVGAGRMLLYRNKKMFADAGLDPDKPPVTWDDLEAVERKITVKDGSDLKRIAFTGDDFKRWLYAAGGRWASDDGRTVQFHLGPAADMVEWVKRRLDSIYGGVAARTAFGSTRSAATVRGGFYTNDLAMTVSNQSIIPDQVNNAPSMQMGISACPVMRADFPPSPAAFLSGYCVSAGTKTPLQAFQFVKWITWDDRGVGWFFRQMGRPSPIKKQNDNPELRKLNPDWDNMIAAMARDVFLPNTGIDKDIDALWTPVWNDALAGKTVARQGLQEAAAAAQTQVAAFWASVPAGR